MSKRLFGSFHIPGTGIEIRCFHDTEANNNPYSVYVRHRYSTPLGWRWTNKLITRYYDYRSCVLCLDSFVNLIFLWEINGKPVLQYLMDHIESNYRPVPKANRKEE